MRIDVYCHTNIDEYRRESWPEVMTSEPRVGDYVESKEHHRLRIVSITHSYAQRITSDPIYLLLELHR